MTNPEECLTRIIQDAPAQEDLLAFHGDVGPHKRVAQAITDMIRSKEESGGKMIGLEGGWGSGKTTVINLIRNDLDINNDITVFSFDAWAHEGDPLRRTFLESLIRHFQKISWILDAEKWTRILEGLAKRRKVTETRTVPKATILGTIFGISIFLVPIGSPFVTTALRKGITIDSSLPIAWGFCIGIILVCAPFIVLLINYFRVIYNYYSVRKLEGKNADTLKSESEKDKISDWAFLTGNAITETKQDTTETPDPTSIEFESHFTKLMREVLPAGSERQAIVVLDNLDRVDPKDALSIWATLQTFLQDRSAGEEDWFKKLWIIVPYDPVGLRALWEKRGAGYGNVEVQSTQSDGQDKTDHFISDSFLDKSFQLRFEVPQLVLSNWKAYLKKLIEKALPGHIGDDQHSISRVFNLCRANISYAPTPRELKLYVNQIGVIHRQWKHEFPISHIAYYIILRRNHVDINQKLLDGQIPDPNIEGILPLNIRANLSGLIFNVQANIGQQLLLSDPIMEALAKNDVEKLKELEQFHQDGFWVVLENVLTSEFVDTESKTVANAAMCLNQLEALKDNDRAEASTVLKELGRTAINVKTWLPIDEDIGKGIAITCRLVANPDVSQQIVSNIRTSLKKPGNKDQTVAVTEDTIKALVAICKEIETLNHQHAIEVPFTLPVDSEGWIEVCSYLSRQESKWWSHFLPQAKFEEISQILSATISSGQFTSENHDVIRITQESLIPCNWDNVALAMEQRLDPAQNPDSTEGNYLLNGLNILRELGCSNATNALESLATKGILMHFLQQALSQNSKEYATKCIVIFLEHFPNAEKQQVVGNAEEGYAKLTKILKTPDPDWAQRIVSVLGTNEKLMLLFTIVDERQKYDPLIIECLRVVVKGNLSELFFAPELVLKRWKALNQHLHEDEGDIDLFDKLVSNLCENAALSDFIQKSESGFQQEDAELYLKICRHSSSNTFRNWCRDGLAGIDRERWRVELEQEGFGLQLMWFLLDTEIIVGLKQNYQDAIVDHATKVLTGKVIPSDKLISQKEKLVVALGTEAAQKIVRKRLLDAAMDQDGNCADLFFGLYGHEISDTNVLAKNNVISRLFSPLIRERVLGGLHWLKGVISNNPALLNEYNDKDAVQDFRERLEGEFMRESNGDDEAHQIICEIARILGIEPKEDLSDENGNPEGDAEKE